MVYSIEEIRRLVVPVAQKYAIPAIFLFGSYARGEAAEESDIDLLVDTSGTELTTLMKLGALYCDLEEALGKQIDLVTVRSIMAEPQMPSDLFFREQVLKERVELHVA